jgi:hypothetical protein
VIGNFILCNVMKRNDKPLHSGGAEGHERDNAGGPGFIGRKIGKRRNEGVFKNVIDLFRRVIACVRGEAESPARQAQWGLAPDRSVSQFDQGK